ncbi:uncharacterized protein J7T54_003742 [Emericellopsis cladophorae]|uniref:Transcription initiation factor TFIID subunit 13 n=1 Tax=Emericellopsis cladophorae TaxID=2686198 RepID=A0A9P9XXR5_9HYPO|nr:uncharacterized protein J7T54_003742 [Emericellopsis cladophorae]KAI6779818.1 hypothetical protein J7T54_003742 [Emericellopsis cladophorae]
MEPRARAAKNVGKMNFSVNDLSMILFAHGDVREPLPETVRVFDEILTDFMQSIAFEAARAAQYSGRQKIKYEDFEFAFRKNPIFLGKVQETFEKSKEIKRVRDIMQTDESALAKEVAEEEKAQARNAGKSKAVDEELGEADDDADAQMDAVGKKR